MPYQVSLISRVERENRIRAALAASTRTEDFYDFRATKTALKVIRLEVGLPIYRIENCRTYTAQKEYVVREKKPSNYFQVGQENETIQQLQHEILAELAATGRDSVTPVLDVLKKEKQRETILITTSGVVVNGNRRLAAMRELFDDDSTANAELGHVDCMVLPPDTTPEEIIDIEAALQGKRETKLRYDWVGDSTLIGKMVAMGKSTAQIADKLHRKDSEIRNALEARLEADLYLKDWVKAEGEYSRVTEDGGQFFKDLPKLLQNKPQPLVEASRVLAWSPMCLKPLQSRSKSAAPRAFGSTFLQNLRTKVGQRTLRSTRV